SSGLSGAPSVATTRGGRATEAEIDDKGSIIIHLAEAGSLVQRWEECPEVRTDSVGRLVRPRHRSPRGRARLFRTLVLSAGVRGARLESAPGAMQRFVQSMARHIAWPAFPGEA